MSNSSFYGRHFDNMIFIFYMLTLHCDVLGVIKEQRTLFALGKRSGVRMRERESIREFF